MPRAIDQVLTAAQMRGAEAALVAAGSSAGELMQRAGHGAADWIWRMAGHRTVTVLCGPGNNGGDGYVIAEALRARGGKVAVIAATEPATDAAREARSGFAGVVLAGDAAPQGQVLVDCLFGTGLSRPLADDHRALLQRLAATHDHRIAIDVPSGVDSDSGAALNPGLPQYQLTLALGAWKQAHFLMPACALMGALRLVDIGIGQVENAAGLVAMPRLAPPAPSDHKYRRGLLGVVAGEMPGAATLAGLAAQGAGAGYVRLIGSGFQASPPDLVIDAAPLADCLKDTRWSALLVGPGLGRSNAAAERLRLVLGSGVRAVLDADALVLLQGTGHQQPGSLIATPHDGELAALERTFLGREGTGSRPERSRALAEASGLIIVAKGPDTVIAAPGGRLCFAPRATSWLSTAGTGDVLAGTIASRLANGTSPFDAACQGVWLHGKAARLAGPAFSAAQLAAQIRNAYAACL